MIKQPMHLNLGGLTLGLDNSNADISFVSHAHSDHVNNGIKNKEKIIASDETIALAGLKGKNVSLNSCRLLHAGHMLGAKQMFVEHDGKSIVYTGDLSIRPNLITKGAEIPACDRLIMEATYGDPQYIFPPYEQVCDDFVSWISKNSSFNLLIGCYEMGKAQEIIKILNKFCGAAPIVKEKTEAVCKVYGKFGINLDRVAVGTEEAEEAMSKPFVAIIPMRQAKRYFARRLAESFERPTLVCNVTGWALNFRFNVDASFPLSDHCDFNELKYFIEQSGAREVEFFHGDGSRLLEACGLVEKQKRLIQTA